MAKAKTIMLQGTSSDVGKSVLCTALCRIFYQQGFRTVPFKAQNMALNSAVTPDGGEIGRAQAVQAEAAGLKADVMMNPILLKPKQDITAQVIVMGVPVGDMSAQDYRYEYLMTAESIVRYCIEYLKDQYEVMVIEGAGSPAEINLKDRDIVNMKTAQLADAPVLLVADIDRGGVFASIVGTLELLEDHERQRIKGFIINKFRGDIDLLQPGLTMIEARTGIPVLGVIPYLHNHGIEEEDSVSLLEKKIKEIPEAGIQVAVLELPRISNFTDFDVLYGIPDVNVRFIKKGMKIGAVDMLIIPGSKNSILDLQYLKDEGYLQEICDLAWDGKFIVGICGGYQMLGMKLLDPLGSESGTGDQVGIGLLDIETIFEAEKQTHQVEAVLLNEEGFWKELKGQIVRGYEIHSGKTQIIGKASCLLEIKCRSGQQVQVADGAVNRGGRVFGTYLHGFFDNPSVLLALMNAIRQEKGMNLLVKQDLTAFDKELNYDRLAQAVRASLDMQKIFEIMGIEVS